MALPMPLPAPVTMATCPLSGWSVIGIRVLLGSCTTLREQGRRAARLSPLLIRQEFAVVGHDHAVALRVFLLANVHFEVDGAHNAVSKHLMNERFDGCAIDLGNFMEAINERVYGHGTVQGTLAGDLLQRFRHLRSETEHLGCCSGFFG